MIRQKVIDTLAADGPLTIEQLHCRLGVPLPILRASLATEFYRQVEIDHPEHGSVTAWTLRPSALRVDGAGRYLLPEAA